MRSVASAISRAWRLLATGFNCPPTSSTGRWFDAAAAALGLSVRQTHEAEAAVALEQQARSWIAVHGWPSRTDVVDTTRLDCLDLRPLLLRLLDHGAAPGADVADEAAWFHGALAEALAAWAGAAARESGAHTVCLGGGCFCNAVLTEQVVAGLQRRGLRVLKPQAHTCGDAALALGQAWVAAHQLHAGGQPLSIEVNESLSCA